MSIIKISDAKEQFESLVTRAEAGETILIEKDGKTVARLVALEGELRPAGEQTKFDWDALRRFTDSQPLQTESAGEFMRRLRDEDRY